MKRDRVTAGKAPAKSAKDRHSTTEAGTPRPIRKALRHVLLLAAVIGATFLAYSNSLHAPFLMDSNDIVLRDARVHTVSAVQFHRILTREYWETIPNGLYRPFTTLSYLFNYAILGNGTDPEGYHWFNLILHALNISLVYALGLALFEEIPAAVLLSALWGLHPVLTESVTYIVGRADLLAAFAVLAALLCHRQAVRSSGVRKAAWIAAIACVVAAGMFSKENAIVAIAVIVLYDLTFECKASWRSRLPSYLAAGLPCLVFLYVRARVIADFPYSPTPFSDNPLLGASFWTARMTAVKVIGRYFGLLLWPANLSCDHSYNEVPLFAWGSAGWDDFQAVLALLACLGAVLIAVRSWRRHKPLFFAIAFFFVTLAPVSNVFLRIGTIMGERLLYLPAVGFAAAAVYVLGLLWRRIPASPYLWRYAFGAALLLILVASVARTYDRNRDWQDQHSLWASALAAAPGSYDTHLNAATSAFVLTQEDWERSSREVDRALQILAPLPDLQNAPNAYLDAGIFYSDLGDRFASGKAAGAARTAAQWYRKSLDALLRGERIQLAWTERSRQENEKHGKRGVSFPPSRLYRELGRTYMRLSDLPHAVAAFDRGRILESDPDLLEDAASAYRAAGDPRKAARALVEALAVDSGRTQLTPKLVELYAQVDPQGCSVTRQGGSAGLNVDCPLVHGDICSAFRNVAGTYLRRGQQFEAGEVRKVAMKEVGCAAELLQ